MKQRSSKQVYMTQIAQNGELTDQRKDYFNYQRHIAKHFNCNDTAILLRFFDLYCKHKVDGSPHLWMWQTTADFVENVNIKKDKLKTILNNLVELGLVRTGVFNKSSYDRTKWYSLDRDLYMKMISDSKATHEVNEAKKAKIKTEKRIEKAIKNKANVSNSGACDEPATRCEEIRQAIPVAPLRSLKEKNKQKEIQRTKSSDDAITHFNQVTGQHIKLTDRTAVRNIAARLYDGFTIGQIKSVISNQFKQWVNNPDMYKYIRFATLCRTGKFEKYLKALPKVKTTKETHSDALTLSEINSLQNQKNRLESINSTGFHSIAIASIANSIRDLSSSLSFQHKGIYQ